MLNETEPGLGEALNIVLLTEDDLNDDQERGAVFVVRGGRAKHIRTVLQAQDGQSIRVGLLNGRVGKGRIVGGDDESVVLHCEFEEAAPLVHTDLILAIPRPKSLKKLLPEVTALGLRDLYLVRTWRVERSFLTSSMLAEEAFRPLLHEGLMQSRRTREPNVEVELRLMDFFRKVENGLFPEGTLRLVAHPGAELTVADVGIGPEQPVVVAIGPEGGFIEPELRSLRDLNFIPISLGPSPLRVETACVVALGQIALVRSSGLRG